MFATGSMQWNWGLDDYNTGAVPNSPALRPPVVNPAAQQVSRNVLARFVQPPALSRQILRSALAQQCSSRLVGTGGGNVTWSMSPSVGTSEPNRLVHGSGNNRRQPRA